MYKKVTVRKMIINEESIRLTLENNPAACLLAMTTAATTTGKLKKGVKCGPESVGDQTGIPSAFNISSPRQGLLEKHRLHAAAARTSSRDKPLKSWLFFSEFISNLLSDHNNSD